MMRRLKTAVVAGGVMYPAGSAATPELEELVQDPKHWEEAEGDRVAELEAEIERLTAQAAADPDPATQEPQELEDPPPGDPPAEDPPAAQVDYLERTRKQLVDEVQERNSGRGPDEQIVVDAPGNKPELAAALTADDNRSS